MVFCWICCFLIDLYVYLMGLLYLFNFYFVLFVVNYESLVHVLCCCYGKLWCIYCCGLMFLILQYQGLIVNIGNLMCLTPKCEALLMWVFVYKFITHWVNWEMMWREKFIGEFLQLFGTLVDYDRFICEDFRGVNIFFFLGSNISFPLFCFLFFFWSIWSHFYEV